MQRPTFPKITKPLIRRMVKKIVQEFDPEQVILFGSQARGDAGPDSDVDLLVIMEVEGDRFDKGLEVRGALREFLVPKDILITTPDEFAWRRDIVGTIEWPASREGKVMYMRVSEAVLALVREWIVKADNELTAAGLILKRGKGAPTDTVCFHAQQCVEKYLKAILVYRNIVFRRTHEIQSLMGLVPQRYRPVLAPATQDLLTSYAAEARYPGMSRVITLTEARKAAATARRVRREVRQKLPKSALPKKK